MIADFTAPQFVSVITAERSRGVARLGRGGVDLHRSGSSVDDMTASVPVPPPTVELTPAPTLRNFPDRDRYELWSGDELVGVEGYERRDEHTLVLLHTVVTEKCGRAGFARLLVASVLDELSAQGTKIVPVCTYVQSFLERFPQYQPVVAEQ
ncbi:GNAT family N-acetyltransferase [Gordonia sihwensis]|uniref:GNAT family N-acetyltransferase n=1 Tax=Gordonia TaxID=2053 RepID=UPI0031017DA3